MSVAETGWPVPSAGVAVTVLIMSPNVVCGGGGVVTMVALIVIVTVPRPPCRLTSPEILPLVGTVGRLPLAFEYDANQVVVVMSISGGSTSMTVTPFASLGPLFFSTIV